MSFIKFFLFILICTVSCSDVVLAGKSDKIYELPSKYIEKHIDATKGKRRIIMIYASWCPHCRIAMPDMMRIGRKYSDSIIAISVDESGRDFARYVETLEPSPFELILSKDSDSALAYRLQKYGIKPWAGVPYYIVLDKNNKVLFQGNQNPQYLQSFLP